MNRNSKTSTWAVCWLAGVLALAVSVKLSADDSSSHSKPRVAAVSWDIAQTLIALDIEPVAVAQAKGYRKWVAWPPLPASSVDIGRRIEPSLSTLAATKPDLILIGDFYETLRPRLERIAPVENLTIYQPDGRPLARALEVAAMLAERFDRQAEHAALQARLKVAVDRLSAQASKDGGPRKVYIVQFEDANHVRIYGKSGIFHDVLALAGFENAWEGPTNFWGFSAAEFTRLKRAADHLVVIEPVPHRAEVVIRSSPIWKGLPVVRDGRVHRLEPTWVYGGLTSAIRFAELLAETFDEGG